MSTATSPIMLNSTGLRIATALEAQTSGQNLVYLLCEDALTTAITIDPTKAVYRVTPTVSDTTCTIPTPDFSAIPTASAYFCFELEVTVGTGATTLVGPQSGEDFSESTDYEDGDCVIYDGKLYECTTPHSAGAWDATHFTEVTGAALSWTFLSGGTLPTADFANKTVYLSCRYDCTAQTVIANCWRVA